MRNFIIKFLKIFFVFIFSTLIAYNCFLIKNYFTICNEYQVGIIAKDNIVQLNQEKIENLGNLVKIYANLLEEEKDKPIEEKSTYHTESGEVHSLADLYDPLGFSVRAQIDNIIVKLFHSCITISILVGAGISFSYTIITIKKLNIITKIIIGYFAIILIFPPLYMYNFTGRFWNLSITYWYGISKYFYIIYTLIFFLIYIINYIFSVNFANQLNKTIKKKNVS